MRSNREYIDTRCRVAASLQPAPRSLLSTSIAPVCRAQRLDVTPFIFLYAAWLYYYVQATYLSEKEAVSSGFLQFLFVCLGGLHVSAAAPLPPPLC